MIIEVLYIICWILMIRLGVYLWNHKEDSKLENDFDTEIQDWLRAGQVANLTVQQILDGSLLYTKFGIPFETDIVYHGCMDRLFRNEERGKN